MKEDLNLSKCANQVFCELHLLTSLAQNTDGDQLNWFTTYFNIGIIVGAPFSTTVLTFIKPRWWLPGCTMVWSLLVLFMHKAESAKTLFVLR